MLWGGVSATHADPSIIWLSSEKANAPAPAREPGRPEKKGKQRDDSLQPPWAQRGRGGTPRPNTHRFSKIKTRGVARPFLTPVATATD